MTRSLSQNHGPLICASSQALFAGLGDANFDTSPWACKRLERQEGFCSSCSRSETPDSCSQNAWSPKPEAIHGPISQAPGHAGGVVSLPSIPWASWFFVSPLCVYLLRLAAFILSISRHFKAVLFAGSSGRQVLTLLKRTLDDTSRRSVVDDWAPSGLW